MASGTINGGAYSGGYDYYMTWSSVSRGSESNSSDVTLNWIMKKKVSKERKTKEVNVDEQEKNRRTRKPRKSA